MLCLAFIFVYLCLALTVNIPFVVHLKARNEQVWLWISSVQRTKGLSLKTRHMMHMGSSKFAQRPAGWHGPHGPDLGMPQARSWPLRWEKEPAGWREVQLAVGYPTTVPNAIPQMNSFTVLQGFHWVCVCKFGEGIMARWIGGSTFQHLPTRLKITEAVWANVYSSGDGMIHPIEKHVLAGTRASLVVVEWNAYCKLVSTYGGFHKWWYLQMDGLERNIPLKWMI